MNYKAKIEHRIAKDDIMATEAIADTYWHLHLQPRSVWTQDLDMRPWSNPAWFAGGTLGRTGAAQ